MARAPSCRIGQGLAASDFYDRFYSRHYPAGIVVSAKMGHDDFTDDAAGDSVGENSFEAVADLDTQFAVISSDEQDDAVVESFFSDLPLLSYLDAETIDILSLETGYRKDRDLMAALLLKTGQALFQKTGAFKRQQAGVIVDSAAQQRDLHGAYESELPEGKQEGEKEGDKK